MFQGFPLNVESFNFYVAVFVFFSMYMTVKYNVQ